MIIAMPNILLCRAPSQPPGHILMQLTLGAVFSPNPSADAKSHGRISRGYGAYHGMAARSPTHQAVNTAQPVIHRRQSSPIDSFRRSAMTVRTSPASVPAPATTALVQKRAKKPRLMLRPPRHTLAQIFSFPRKPGKARAAMTANQLGTASIAY